jgi:hypothetical protein
VGWRRDAATPPPLITAVAGGALLAGPTALAFFAGGYFDQPRLWAGLVAWLLLLLALVLHPDPLPRGRGGLIAAGGLALLTALTLASIAWAPIAGRALGAGERTLGYLGAMLAAVAWLRVPWLRRALEPALTAGALIAVGYGLSERLLPGVLSFHHSASAEGRLEQPLTYWNAMGELAALGTVLALRLAGDLTRHRAARAAAAAAAVPLALGLYLSFSRGALFACLAGILTLVVAARSRAQLRSLVAWLPAGLLSVGICAPLGGVSALTGALGTRERQGATMLVVLVLCAAAAGAAQWRLARSAERDLRLVRRAGVLTLVLVCAGLAVAIVAGAHESSGRQLGGGVARLTRLESDRYAYWRVALREFAREPLRGVGAEGWAVDWLRERTIAGGALDAHSLPLQTAAELGVLGLMGLALLFGGVALAARSAHRAAPGLVAGPLAGVVAYAAHAPLDWDWQMPALTLPALVLAAALLVDAEPSPAATFGHSS